MEKRRGLERGREGIRWINLENRNASVLSLTHDSRARLSARAHSACTLVTTVRAREGGATARGGRTVILRDPNPYSCRNMDGYTARVLKRINSFSSVREKVHHRARCAAQAGIICESTQKFGKIGLLRRRKWLGSGWRNKQSPAENCRMSLAACARTCGTPLASTVLHSCRADPPLR